MRLKEEYREETVSNRSRFIACVERCETEEEARAYIESIRKEFPDATHVCTAYVCGENNMIQRSSDNKEPSGTAGIPMLKVLEGTGIRNAVVVVTRYFGGTLLGTGGLVRSYTQAAKAALSDAQIVRMCRCKVIGIDTEYGLLDRVLYYLRQNRIEPYDQAYTDRVSLCITVEHERADSIMAGLTALSGGKVIMIELDDGFYPLPAASAD
jgi:uncharacterized YigZ family protein